MVIFDELPLVSLLDAHGRVDRRLYPNFARLAATATWYRDAKTVGDHTTFAVPAIVTGRRPDGHRLPTAASHPDTLFRLLGGSYRLDVSSAFADLCSPAACPERTGPSSGYSLRRLLAISVGTFPVLPARVREELHGWLVPGAPAPAPRGRLSRSIRRQGLDVLAADDAQQVAGFLGALAPSSERTLNFAHLMTPHSPWVHLPSGQTYLGSNARGVRIRPEDPVVNAYGYRQHLSEVGYADHVLGQLIDRLKALGTFDESLIVVVADHGISFIPGEPDRDVTEENAGQIVGVPLLVKAPDQTRGETLDSPVETTDLVPTIAALLKTRIPWKVDGLPANRVAAGSRPDVVVSRDKGGRLTVSRARLTTLEGEALREKLRLFDDGNPFALGPLGGELGREVGIVTPAAQLHVTIANVAAYRDVAPRAAALPAEIRGTIAGDRPQRRPLAIAINGRVAATTESTVVGGREVFAALVPRFDAGNNLIRVLTEGPRSHRLTEIPYQR
jgi:hypothetical protein